MFQDGSDQSGSKPRSWLNAASGDAGRSVEEPRPARDQADAVSGDGGAPCGRWLNDRGPERGREAPDGKED